MANVSRMQTPREYGLNFSRLFPPTPCRSQRTSLWWELVACPHRTPERIQGKGESMARKFLGSLWYASMACALAIPMLPILSAGQRGLGATTVSASVTEQNVPSGSISSNPFSTTGPNTLVVALIGTDGPTSGGQRFPSVEGGGLAWQPAVHSNGELGDAEIWYAVAPTPVVDMVVT